MAAASALGKTPATSIQQACHNPQCDKLAAVAKRCTVCWAVRYCSKACQVADWQAHKVLCRKKQEINLGLAEFKPSIEIAQVIVDVELALFPIRLNEPKWKGLQKLITDHNLNFPSIIPAKDRNKIVILLTEIGNETLSKVWTYIESTGNKHTVAALITMGPFIQATRNLVIQEIWSKLLPLSKNEALEQLDCLCASIDKLEYARENKLLPLRLDGPSWQGLHQLKIEGIPSIITQANVNKTTEILQAKVEQITEETGISKDDLKRAWL